MSIAGNEKWSKRLQWSPRLWGFDKINKAFVKHIKPWQYQHGLDDDGIVGPNTFRIWLKLHQTEWKNAVIINGVPHRFNFDDSVRIVNPWTFLFYKNEDYVFTLDGKGYQDRKDPPSGIVIHNALCYDADNALHVFDKTKYIPHFFVDERGNSIYQLFDPVPYHTYHVGARSGKFNASCIGIDNVNILETKHIDKSRNIHKDVGQFLLYKSGKTKKKEFLKLFPKQVRTCWRLCECLCEMLDIKLEHPDIEFEDGMPILGDVKGVPSKNLGVVAHGMIQKNRWDGFDFFYGLLGGK